MEKGYSQEELIIFNFQDNIGIIKNEINKGKKITISAEKYMNTIDVKETIPRGFKIALKDFDINESVIKMGEVIGVAKRKISKGEMVHVHNIEGLRARGDRVGNC